MTASRRPRLLVGAITFNADETTVVEVASQLAALPGMPLVVDNSTVSSSRESVRRACRSYGVAVLGDGVNRGSAGGLNLLLAVAAQQGMEWILYFDQDSRVVTDYGRFLQELSHVPSEVAVVGSLYGAQAAVSRGPVVEDARYLISSGCFMRTSALLEVDGFDEAFFLDLVDHELCLRLRRHGWHLRTDNRLVMTHMIGSGTCATVGRITVRWHSPWRRRIMWRNSWWWLSRTRGPREVWEPVRSLALRGVETLVSALHFRSWGCLGSAVLGTLDALAGDGDRRGFALSGAAEAAAALYLPTEDRTP